MIYLDQLLQKVEVVAKSGNLHIPISGIHMDSRKIREGYCFVAIRGLKDNGAKYLGDVIAAGASAIVLEQKPDETFPDIPFSVSWVMVKNARIVLSKMAAAFYGQTADYMYNVGITGTNGKTTVMSLIHAIYSKEHLTARIGTLGMAFNHLEVKTGLTTPEAVDIFDFLAQAHKGGCNNLVMEASSVALKLHRVDNIRFSQGVFTNFTGDHLDFHKTMEQYLDAKLELFRKLGEEDWAVVNLDDPQAPKVLEHLNCRYITYGFSAEADVHPVRFKFSINKTRAHIQTPRGELEIKSSLVGRVNLSNLMAAVTSAVIRGISSENISAAISEFKPVKGRLDTIYDKGFAVMIDYAHTDNALESMLKSVREIVPGKIILVFGAGGSRDKSKRPRMGAAASKNAGFLVVTSDNPRQEDPNDIIKDIIAGFESGFDKFITEPDRKRAIQKAIQMAEEDDLVVIAGKGHEDYQVFKDKTIHFDDYEVARSVLEKMESDFLDIKLSDTKKFKKPSQYKAKKIDSDDEILLPEPNLKKENTPHNA